MEKNLEVDSLDTKDAAQLFFELTVRLSALESLLLQKKVILEKELAEFQIMTMNKIKEVIENTSKNEQSLTDTSKTVLQ